MQLTAYSLRIINGGFFVDGTNGMTWLATQVGGVKTKDGYKLTEAQFCIFERLAKKGFYIESLADLKAKAKAAGLEHSQRKYTYLGIRLLRVRNIVEACSAACAVALRKELNYEKAKYFADLSSYGVEYVAG